MLFVPQPASSRFLEQAYPDLLPENDIEGGFLVPFEAVIQLGPLRVHQFILKFQGFGFFGQPAELSVRTFCIFLREFSSRQRTLSRSPSSSRS
jgi:hypothetical protein